MIINNTHVQGIFLFSETMEYEKGDFVVYGNTIYICTAEEPTNQETFTVSGIIPDSDDGRKNYSVYPGDRIITADEYFKYIENPSVEEDKFISSNVLSEILSTYMNGFDEKGIITSYVISNNGIFNYSSDLAEYLNNISIDNILDALLKVDKLNNAIFRISRSIVSNIFSMDFSTAPDDSNFTEKDRESIILRQFTYINSSEISGSNENKYRIQELLDPIHSIVMYRCARYPFANENIVTNWKSSCDSYEFLNQVNYIRTYYDNLISELQNEYESKEKEFAFKEVKLYETLSDRINKPIYGITLTCDENYKDSVGYISVNSFEESCVITITIRESSGSDISKNTSFTIDLSDSFDELVGFKKYYISDQAYLQVDVNGSNSVSLNIIPNYSVEGNERREKFINIYYHKYKNE